jgi:hypothetical protein
MCGLVTGSGNTVYGQIAYILFSEGSALLWAWAGMIAMIATFTGSTLLFGVLLCILVARQNKGRREFL